MGCCDPVHTLLTKKRGMSYDPETVGGEEHLLGALNTLYRRRKLLLYAFLLTCVGSAVISLLLPVYYQASTIFLSASPDQAKPGVLFGGNSAQLNYYGSTTDTERLLTLAESNELLEFLIDSFDLYPHYDINSDHPKAAFLIRRKLKSLYSVVKTKRDAVALQVEDRDAELAARMANAAREKIGQMALSLVRSAQTKAVQAFESEMAAKERELSIFADSLQRFRQQYGIYNMTAQSENLTTLYAEAISELADNRSRLETLEGSPAIPKDTLAYMRATVGGLEQKLAVIQSEMNRYNEGVYKMNFYERQYYDINEALSALKLRRKEYGATLSADTPALILVESAETPLVKSRPQRSLLVLLSGGVALFLSVFGILLLEAYRSIDWPKVFHD